MSVALASPRIIDRFVVPAASSDRTTEEVLEACGFSQGVPHVNSDTFPMRPRKARPVGVVLVGYDVDAVTSEQVLVDGRAAALPPLQYEDALLALMCPRAFNGLADFSTVAFHHDPVVIVRGGAPSILACFLDQVGRPSIIPLMADNTWCKRVVHAFRDPAIN
jgi:hypothetical protein